MVQSDVDKELLSGTEESIKTVNLMPEYLVVCCWRSIKEVSLLLGQLTQTAPLVKASGAENGEESSGILSVKQVCTAVPNLNHKLVLDKHIFLHAYLKLYNANFTYVIFQIHNIGEYFVKQLLESRHRGAFELAYAGFVKMTEMLWR